MLVLGGEYGGAERLLFKKSKITTMLTLSFHIY